MSSSGARLDPALVAGALEEAVPDVVAEYFDGKVVLRDDDGKVPEADLPDRLGSAVLTAAIAAAATARPHAPLIVFVGESNTGGLGPNSDLSAPQLAVRPAVKIWRNDTNDGFDSLDIGTNNLRGHDQITGVNDPLGGGTYDQTRHGWENALATSAEAGDWAKQVYLVKAGQGGSRLSQWDPGSPFWVAFTTRLTAAVAALRAQGLEPDVYLWSSIGINDSANGLAAATYRTQLVAWLARVRAVVTGLTGAPNVPVAFTTFPPNYATYTAQLRTIVDPYLFLVETAAAPVQADNAHWTAAGMALIGAAMSSVMRTAIGQGAQYAATVASPSSGQIPLTAQVAALSAQIAARPARDLVAGDDFNRANGALGSTPFGSKPWLYFNGAMAVFANQAGSSSRPNNAASTIAYLAAGINGSITARRVGPGDGGDTIIWRLIDETNYYTLAMDGQVYKYVAGVFTALGASLGAIGLGSLITVDVSGRDFTVTVDGVKRGTITDSTLTTGTGMGISTGDTSRWDDFSFAI